VKRVKRVNRFGALALAALVLAGCGSPQEPGQQVVEYHAAYPAFATATDLVKASDLVVRGVAVANRVETIYPEPVSDPDPQVNPQAGLSEDEARQSRQEAGVVVTVTTVRITEALKGSGVAEGDLIELSQLGGTLGDTLYQNVETLLMPLDGSGYVMFLAAHGDKPYDLLNPEQGLLKELPGGLLAPVGDLTGGLLGSLLDLRVIIKETD
jgi:hypothetical protein